MEPTELAGKRTERRRRLREQSPDVLVALPDTDGDLARALADLEEVLLKVLDVADDHEQALPAPLVDPQSVEAVGKLASYVGRVERAVESERPLVQPLAPDGRYELVPLHFVRLNRDEHARKLAAVGQLAAAGTPTRIPPSVRPSATTPGARRRCQAPGGERRARGRSPRAGVGRRCRRARGPARSNGAPSCSMHGVQA